jgi:hypothetical protein
MNAELVELIAFQRAEFAKAGRLRMCMIGAQAGVAVAAVASIFVGSRPYVLLFALGGTIALGIWVLLDTRYRACRESCGRARRASLIMGGLGQTVSPAELLAIRETFSVSPEQAKPFADPNYFASKAEPGRKRLGEMLQESAFWTSRLQAASAKLMWMAFVGSVVLSGAAFTLVVALGSQSVGEHIARVVIAILALLMSTDILGSAISHGSAAAFVDRLVTRLSDAEGRGYPEADVLLILSDYNAAVEAAAIAIPGLYEFHSKRLKRLYDTYQSSRTVSLRTEVAHTNNI